MNKEDRRVSRTQQALGEALVDLATEVGYEQVTIKDITRRANIGYSTFFRHFKSKDAMLLQLMKTNYLELKELIRKETTQQGVVVALYRFAREHAGLFLLSTRLPRDNEGLNFVWNDAAQVISELYRAEGEGKIPLNALVSHLISSSTELLRWYLESDNNYSPEEMAAIHYELIVTAVEHLDMPKRSGSPPDVSNDQGDMEHGAVNSS